MEEVGNQNFACKFCNQGFASGRSLGGHMRWWHVHSIEFDEKRNITVKGFKAGERSGYGLRENPKKFSRVTASISNRRGHSEMQSDRLTVFVPKRKRSTRYLDLSRSNSEPSSSVAMYLLMLSAGKTFGYGLRENPKKSSGFMASNKRCYSDHLTAFVPKRKRSRTARYFDLCCSNSNASSSIDQELKIDQELEDEVAMALLMLSRGVPNLAGISSISDTDPIADYRVGNLGNPNSSDCGNVEFGGDEQKRVGLEDSVDGFSGIDSSVTEMAEWSKGLRNGTGSETFEFNPRKKARLDDAFEPELKVIPRIKIKVPKVFDDLLKEGKYKCRACGKIFYSHQALGGHRSCCHNLEVGGSRHELKKSKVHQCPICFRVFASGQALGGHMGAHSVTNSGVKVRQAIHPVIDLLLRKKSSMVILASTNAG